MTIINVTLAEIQEHRQSFETHSLIFLYSEIDSNKIFAGKGIFETPPIQRVQENET
jgi:hypothetical protein